MSTDPSDMTRAQTEEQLQEIDARIQTLNRCRAKDYEFSIAIPVMHDDLSFLRTLVRVQREQIGRLKDMVMFRVENDRQDAVRLRESLCAEHYEEPDDTDGCYECDLDRKAEALLEIQRESGTVHDDLLKNLKKFQRIHRLSSADLDTHGDAGTA